MNLASMLVAVVLILGATAICVILFERLGFGAVLGIIVAGVILGPHTPGPIPVAAVEEPQSVAELGVVLLGLRMPKPRHISDAEDIVLGNLHAAMVSRDNTIERGFLPPIGRWGGGRSC